MLHCERKRKREVSRRSAVWEGGREQPDIFLVAKGGVVWSDGEEGDVHKEEGQHEENTREEEALRHGALRADAVELGEKKRREHG